MREIGKALKLNSSASVYTQLKALEENGYIRREPSKPRAIEVCDDSFKAVRNDMM